MTSDEKTPEGFSLKRWSRVKREVRREIAQPAATAPANATVVPATETVVPANAGKRAAPAETFRGTASQRLSPNAMTSPTARGRPESVPAIPVTTAGATPGPEVELPPIESLTIDSDFTAFLQPKVNEALKRKALKKLFGDPHFNVMDRLDVYIDDYSQPDLLAPEIARQLVQARAILDARPTRINAQGTLEDVPPAENELPAGAVTHDARRPEPAIAHPATPDIAPAPQTEAVPSTHAADKVVPDDVASASDPKAGADPR